MDHNRTNCFVVVDSLRERESQTQVRDSQTAKRLFGIMKGFAAEYAPKRDIRYVRVESKETFLQLLGGYAVNAEQGNFFPLLHLECHGNDDGFRLADGSQITWAELKAPLIALNTAMRLNLIVMVAACVGGALAKAIDITDRAPVWALLGPTRVVWPDELERSFRAFYTTLIRTSSPAEARTALDATAPPGMFYGTTAQELFKVVWAHYQKTLCTKQERQRSARRIHQRMSRRGFRERPIARVKRTLVLREPHFYEQYHTTYFMQDLYPEHRERFNVPYESQGRAADAG